jgi:WD40 repeat protein/predicted Ser/Thr protein kinase
VGRVDRLQSGDPGEIGPFRLLGRLGEGGMGRVFLGESRGGRKVAIKVVHPHYANDPEFRRRFAREVAAARQVGGFHTAAVVGADPDADPPWMATAYIPGPSLAEAVAGGGPLDEAGVRELGAALAEGLAAIHDCGLIHRDLKPANVILADDGPRIIDFGIASGAGATALTGSNAVIGTLRYMSPEQLNGHELTTQSDVFALGAILAYAATGHDPFAAPTMPAVITRILTGPPDLDPITGDLRGIIASCLAKDPGSRPSPDDLLARFSDRGTHDPTVTAAPPRVPAAGPFPEAVPSPEARTTEAGGPAHASVREPSLASTMDVSRVLPPGRTDPSAARADRPAAEAARPAGKPARRGPRGRTGLIAVAAAVVVGLATAGILTLVNRPAPSLSAAGTPPASTLTTTGKLTATLTDPAADGLPVTPPVAFGPGGILAAGYSDGSTYLWNTATGKVTATLTDPNGAGVDSVAFGPGGTLAAGDRDGSTYLWNTATGKVTATLTGPPSKGYDYLVNSVAFGPGGILATGGGIDTKGRTYLWNTATGKVTATLTDPESQGVDSVAFGPGGILAAGDYNGSTYLWNTATGKVTATLTAPAGAVDSVAFGPGGTLAAGYSDGSTYLWDPATGKVTATLTDNANVFSVAFGPGGILAVGIDVGNGDGDGTYLWNTATGKITATLTDPNGGGVFSVAFGPGGILAVGDFNGSTYLWHVTYG